MSGQFLGAGDEKKGRPLLGGAGLGDAGGIGAAGGVGAFVTAAFEAFARVASSISSGGSASGGSGSAGEFCVEVGSYMAAGGIAANVAPGDLIEALDETRAGLRMVEVEAIDTAFEPCVLIETESGARLIVSEPTLITQPDGATVRARDSLGAEAAVKDGRGLRWERLTHVERIGDRMVARISAHQCTYGAGLEPGRFIYTHNIKAGDR